jgi:hypothetical protein
VRDSKTLDLLRAPLILAIAVGLYADRPTMIPSTVSELYHRMIEELLDRHAFRHERRPDESLLVYRRSDKYSLLRQFALSAAETSGNFSDFTRGDLDRFAVGLAPSLEAVDNPSALVDEVITHSGLLTPVGYGNLWHFSHRSIQEFLTAEELRLRGDGDAFLLGKAGDLNWWQAIQYYTAGQEARQVDAFIRDLAKLDGELAAHCLQAAKPSDGAARAVLDALTPIMDARVGALAAASRSPRTSVQSMAVEEFKQFITESEGGFSAVSTGIEGMLPLLESIASTNAGEIAALVPQVIENLADDPRLVGPLWQCLNANGIELRQAECSAIVLRLLTLVMDPNSFTELERQDPQDRDFLTQIRSRAYPFRNALRPDHNLVTLLAWTDYLGVAFAGSNRFLQARTADRLTHVESDRWRTVSFSLSWPGKIISGLGLGAAFGVALTELVTNRDQFLHPFGWWTILMIAGTGIIPFVLFEVFFFLWVESFPETSRVRYYLDSPGGAAKSGFFPDIFEHYRILPEWGVMLITVTAAPFAFALSPVPLIALSLESYIIVSVVAQAAFWMTNTRVFNGDRRYYLYRPNIYVDMYEDPRSRHWLVPGGGPGL